MYSNQYQARAARHLDFRRLCALFSCIAFVACQASGDPMITSNVIHRTFRIQWRDGSGTAFAIDHGQRQYLVTARHVVEGIESGDHVKILHKKTWKTLPVTVVGLGEDPIDVAVLACSVRLAPSLPLPPTSAGLVYGQPVAFLGYPFGWDSGGEHINRGVPLPFVKAGIVSAMEIGDISRIFLDAHGNPGFSGGPVVFVPQGRKSDGLRVAGVVSYYPATWLPIVDRDGSAVTSGEGKPVGYVRENPGIVVAIDIRHALEFMDANPIGFPLPTEDDD